MKNLWQVFQGILIAVASIGLVLGGFSLSLAEGRLSTNPAPIQSPTPTFSPSPQPTGTATASPTASLTPLPSLSPTLTLSLTPGPTSSLPPTPTNCPPPPGWIPYVVQPGDTFTLIAARYRTNSVTLQQANCLQPSGLKVGTILYVPPLPTSTPIPCGAPYSWIIYIVQPGDTLYHLSLSYGITVADLQRANCMGSSVLLHTGQKLYVPPWAPLVPSPTLPPFVTDTLAPLPSDTPTEVPTDTPVPVPSDTPVEIPTDTTAPTTP